MILKLLSLLKTPKQMQFAPVVDDDAGDELIESIKNNPLGADDKRWDLREEVDLDRINAFLNEALAESSLSSTKPGGS